MFRVTPWPALIKQYPNAARNELVKAFRQTLSIVDACKLLGIGRRTFYRQMKKLNIDYLYLLKEAAKRSSIKKVIEDEE